MTCRDCVKDALGDEGVGRVGIVGAGNANPNGNANGGSDGEDKCHGGKCP